MASAGAIAAVGKIEAVGESMGEFVIADELVASTNRRGEGGGPGTGHARAAASRS